MKPFHKMTKSEFVDRLRTLYYAQPKADWDTLAVGNIIVSKGRGWRITHIPPKRGFVLATNVMTGDAEKLLRSKFDNNDLLVTDEATLTLLRTNHQEEIEKAIAKGISISLAVQYDYPELFTPFPASWDEKRQETRPRSLAADKRNAGLQRPSARPWLAIRPRRWPKRRYRTRHCAVGEIPCRLRSWGRHQEARCHSPPCFKRERDHQRIAGTDRES